MRFGWAGALRHAFLRQRNVMHRPAQKNLLTPRAIFHLLFGRPLKTSEAQAQKVGPLHGVPILGLDALGSASYGPEAALTVLMPLGAIGLLYVREVIAAILLLLAILYFSYRQTIAAYPNGGGSYTVAKENLETNLGLAAAAISASGP